jgi:hypothetical protein
VGTQLAVSLGARRIYGPYFRDETPGARGKDSLQERGSLLLFDLRPGWQDQDPIRLIESPASINAIAVSPVQSLLASAGDDRVITLLNPSTTSLADLVCPRVWRNLTPEEWKKYVGEIPYRRTCPDVP